MLQLWSSPQKTDIPAELRPPFLILNSNATKATEKSPAFATWSRIGLYMDSSVSDDDLLLFVLLGDANSASETKPSTNHKLSKVICINVNITSLSKIR